MKTAKEMFEELGYKKSKFVSKDFIEYEHSYIYDTSIFIRFDLDELYITKYDDTDKGVEIYSIYESPFNKPCVCYIELDIDWFFEIENGNLEIRGYDIVGDEFLTDHSLDKLFETKAEAEFCAKYKNIQRTETLDLPTWEEAKIDKLVQIGEVKNGCWDLIKSFTDKKNNEMFEFSLSRDDYNQFYLSVNNEDSSYKDLFYKPLTYENYLEACEVCKKLFMGEKV